jgi:tetratricopeptide (TPR) repeat protein
VRSGHLEEASLCYRTIARLDSDNPRAHARVAASYDVLGSPRAALEICRSALRQFPDAACLHRQLGQILLSLGSIHGALRSLERAAELTPRHGDTYYFTGLALRQAGRKREAREALRRALALRPEDPKLYYALGLCCNPEERDDAEPVGLLLAGIAAEDPAADLAPPRWTQ